MKEIPDLMMVFENWLENMRKNLKIVKFKEFRKEMYDFVKEIDKEVLNETDMSTVSKIVEKYMEK